LENNSRALITIYIFTYSNLKTLTSAFQILQNILKRYEYYERFLNYPGDWGERAFRGWLIYDLFHDFLKWPIKNIVFGERFDVLLVNNEIKPIINIETKKPGRGLSEYDAFKKRLSDYQTLYYALLTDGKDWMLLNCLDKSEIFYKIGESEEKFNFIIRPLLSKRYLSGEKTK